MEKVVQMMEFYGENEEFAKIMEPLMSSGDIGAIIAAAKEHGFDITTEELNKYFNFGKQLYSGGKAELDPEGLENVVGGSNPKGSFQNPLKRECWFFATNKHSARDGATYTKCGQFSCRVYKYSYSDFLEQGWHACLCWNTSKCADSYHISSGC